MRAFLLGSFAEQACVSPGAAPRTTPGSAHPVALLRGAGVAAGRSAHHVPAEGRAVADLSGIGGRFGVGGCCWVLMAKCGGR